MVSNQNLLPKVFEHEKFGKIRIFVIDGEIKFVAADVCRALEIKNPSDTVKKVLHDDEKGVDTIYTLGGPQKMLVVNEPGLYRLIFLSRKPEAEEMKRWVFHDVLPQIRKYGFYSLDDEISADVEKSDVEELFENGLDAETLAAIEECDATFRKYTKSPNCEILPKSHNVIVGDTATGLNCVYRYVIQKERVFVPFIYYPKYNCGNLVFTKRDIMGLLNISEGVFHTSFKHLQDKIEFKLLRGEELKSFISNNPVSIKPTCLYIFPRDSVYAFFEYFGVEVPEELKKICTVMKRFDQQFVSDFINKANTLNNQLEHAINKFANEMIFNGVCKKAF